jgi:integrase
MARRVKDATLDSRASRLKLKPRGKPFWKTLERQTALGYRRLTGKAGTWWGRYYLGEGQYKIEALGIADDLSDANDLTILSFWQAVAKAREQMNKRAKIAAGIGDPLTVIAALDRYEDDLAAREAGADNGIKRVRLHLPDGLAKTLVRDLTVDSFKPWHARLRQHQLSRASINRIGNSLRAALNGAADAEHIADRSAWKIGLKGLRGATKSRNVILPDSKVLAIVAEAYRESAEFGLLIETAAGTGARYSQLVRVEVQDLQADRNAPRVMMPSSRKGRGEKKITHRPVPITPELAARLLKFAGGRPGAAPLLVKPNGQPWGKSEQKRSFVKVRERAGLEAGVSMYSLRHSSIVRQLLAGVPIRVVAVTHDTSTVMIEATYSAHINDHADEITRKALLDTSEASKPSAGANVLSITRSA